MFVHICYGALYCGGNAKLVGFYVAHYCIVVLLFCTVVVGLYSILTVLLRCALYVLAMLLLCVMLLCYVWLVRTSANSGTLPANRNRFL